MNDANQHALIFFSSQCSNLDLSHHCRQEFALISDPMLLAGRETAGMSLENMYLVHLDSMDKEQLYREKRGYDPCKNISPAERGSEERFAMHAGVALRDL